MKILEGLKVVGQGCLEGIPGLLLYLPACLLFRAITRVDDLNHLGYTRLNAVISVFWGIPLYQACEQAVKIIMNMGNSRAFWKWWFGHYKKKNQDECMSCTAVLTWDNAYGQDKQFINCIRASGLSFINYKNPMTCPACEVPQYQCMDCVQRTLKDLIHKYSRQLVNINLMVYCKDCILGDL